MIYLKQDKRREVDNMNKKEILEKLLGLYFDNMTDARKCQQMGYRDTADQARHQALGVQQSAEAILGIDSIEFSEHYHNYRRNRRALERQEVCNND